MQLSLIPSLVVSILLSACAFAPSDAFDTEAKPATIAQAYETKAPGAVKHLALATGIDMAYVELGRACSPPVILVHGYTDSHHSFDRNLHQLSRSLHVYGLDLRGHGDSSKPNSGYAQADFAADVVAFMDAQNIHRTALVGHSMGSFVVQRVALDYPSRVARVVLIGSAPTVAGNPGATDLLAAVSTLEDPVDPEFVRAFQASTFFRPIPETFLDTAVEDSLKVPATVWKQALTGLIAEDHTSALPRLTAPTLILYGDQDAFFSLSDQEELDTTLPNSTLVVYPQAGHAPHVEVPHLVNRRLAGFLVD